MADLPAGDGHRRPGVDALIAPDSVAIVGASQTGVGRAVVENLLTIGYAGQLGCVNPRYDEIAGVSCAPTIGALGFVPDVAVLAVGRERVPALLAEAAEAGVRAAVIFALGMGIGDELARSLQSQVIATATEHELAVLGPNCQGAINFARGVALYMSQVREYRPGRVALVSHSGSVLTGLLNNRRGVRFSHAVSTGNEAVTDAADLLGAYAEDPATDVICAHLETIRRPSAFFAQCDRARAAGKSVVVHAVGITERGQAAAVAHTGALALPHRLLVAALRRHHVAVVESLDELLETAKAMQVRRRPRGGRLAAITGSGGHIELVEDAIAGLGLSLPELSPETRSALSDLLPPFLEPCNPLDWWGTRDDRNRVAAIVDAVAADEHVDIVVEIDDFASGFVSNLDRGSRSLGRAIAAAGRGDALRAIIDPVAGAPQPEHVEAALAADAPLLSGVADGLRALGHLVASSRRPPAPRPAAGLDRDDLRARWSALADGVNAGPAVLDLLSGAGLDVIERQVVASVDEALAAAARLGYPVVAKTAEDAVAHKTERGGVLTDLNGPAQLATAASRLLGDSRRVIVQRQVDGGVELIVGLRRHPLLGGFVVVGAGGVFTEVLDDVCIRCAGLGVGEAGEMLGSLRCAALLEGARGRGRYDLQAAVAAIERLDDLADVLSPGPDELEINPLIVTATRAVVVDALAITRRRLCTEDALCKSDSNLYCQSRSPGDISCDDPRFLKAR